MRIRRAAAAAVFVAVSSTILAMSLPTAAVVLAQAVPAGVPLTIPTPEPLEFLVALDEMELDWTSAAPAARPADQASVATVPGITVIGHDRDRTVLRVDGAATAEEMTQALGAQEAVNPGARAHVVVYESGRPRSAASRRTLTSEVVVLLDRTTSINAVLAGTALRDPQGVPGLSTGWVVRAGDPLAAVEAARRLATLPGVKTAYPLMKHSSVTR
jgi:hypothetical protein